MLSITVRASDETAHCITFDTIGIMHFSQKKSTSQVVPAPEGINIFVSGHRNFLAPGQTQEQQNIRDFGIVEF